MDANSQTLYKTLIDEEIKCFTPSITKLNFANTRRHVVINSIIFSISIVSFSLAIFLRGFLQAAALEIGLLLLSIKLMYFMYNTLKFNHYLFWVFQSFDMKLIDMKKDLLALDDQLQPRKTQINTDTIKN
ncbi:MAG: hypothetical protein AB1454_00495 [Candidatus Auribacterota bacterium]